MKKALTFFDSLINVTGEFDKFLAILLVMVMCFEVVMRYLFNSPTIWGYDTSVMIGITLYALAWSYADLYNQHVRVDIIYIKLSSKGKAVIDVIGYVLFFLPFILTMIYTSYTWMVKAWVEHEVRSETYWYPPAGPIRTIFFLGILLFTIRGTVRLIRDINTLRSKPA